MEIQHSLHSLHWFIDLFIVYKSGFDFSADRLAKFSENPVKVNFELLVHILRYIRYNKTLGMKYYSNINYAPVSDLLRQSSIKTENQLMGFSDSSCKDFPDTGIITGAYIIFYQGGTIDHGTHVPGPVSQLIA